MASELKPFGYAPGSYMNNCKSCGQSFMGDKRAWNCEPCAKALSLQADTRPAPAATDTGLVTVGNITEECLLELKQMLCGEIHPCNDIGDVTDADIELCTRSQAEELLAAERAKYCDAMEKLVESQRETLVWQQRAINLKSDNAAKAARIKELDRCHEGTIDLCNQKTAQIEALEAKLAAAEKVREAAIELDEAISDDFNIFGAQQKLRAALGGKPS